MGLGDRLRRLQTLARVGSAAVKMRRADAPEARERARVALAEVLSDARGVPMKVAQFLGTGDDGGALGEALRSVSPLPLETARPEIERWLGQPWDAVFTRLEPARAAASLGQVHEAELRSGERVAVKLRYPDIEEAVVTELAVAGLVPGLGPVKRWGFDLDGYRSELARDLEEELDYTHEARTQANFRAAVRVDGLEVPAVYPELCRPGLLVQAWSPGRPLSELSGAPLGQRLRAARTLLRTAFRSIFVSGWVHADPHPGNLAFRSGPGDEVTICLYDYGCVLRLDPAQREGLLTLIAATRAEIGDRHADLERIGFDGEKLRGLDRERLERLSRVLLEPFCVDRAYDLTTWRMSERMEEELGEAKWWFRSAAPAPLFFLVRALHGMTRFVAQLDARLPWWPLLVEQVGEAAVEAALARARADAPTRGAGSDRWLKVAVEGGGRDIHLSYPGREVARLRELVPEEVARTLSERGIDLATLERRGIEATELPFTLFDLEEEDGRHLKVWLE